MRFRDQALLREALTHGSALNEQPDRNRRSYDRLELLGDAFLGWTVARELFSRFPAYDEGDLTRARSALVSGAALAEVAAGIGLGAHLILGAGEDAGGGRRNPRTLAAAVEAVVGAAYLDRGERGARKLVLRLLGDRLDAIGPGSPSRHPKSALQELLQRDGRPAPQYRVDGAEGAPPARRFAAQAVVDGDVLGEGAGRTKAEAERRAAEDALRRIGDG